MARVLATDEAKAAISSIQGILNGTLTETIARLQAEGTVLSSPDQWDGQLAHQFRSDIWPQHQQALTAVKGALDALHQQVQRINADILAAGGNG